jgi:hypothetical protein
MLKTAVIETINAYPLEAIHVYIDGSAFKATLKWGFGEYLDISESLIMKIMKEHTHCT